MMDLFICLKWVIRRNNAVPRLKYQRLRKMRTNFMNKEIGNLSLTYRDKYCWRIWQHHPKTVVLKTHHPKILSKRAAKATVAIWVLSPISARKTG